MLYSTYPDNWEYFSNGSFEWNIYWDIVKHKPQLFFFEFLYEKKKKKKIISFLLYFFFFFFIFIFFLTARVYTSYQSGGIVEIGHSIQNANTNTSVQKTNCFTILQTFNNTPFYDGALLTEGGFNISNSGYFCVNNNQTTQAPTTQIPTTQMPTTQIPTTQLPTTQTPNTQVPTTQFSSTQTPSTLAPSMTIITQMPITCGSQFCQSPQVCVNGNKCGNSISCSSSNSTCFRGVLTIDSIPFTSSSTVFQISESQTIVNNFQVFPTDSVLQVTPPQSHALDTPLIQLAKGGNLKGIFSAQFSSAVFTTTRKRSAQSVDVALIDCKVNCTGQFDQVSIIVTNKAGLKSCQDYTTKLSYSNTGLSALLSPDSSNCSSNNRALIIGLAVGVPVAVALVLIIAVIICKMKRKRSAEKTVKKHYDNEMKRY